jgi:hypothetical protein
LILVLNGASLDIRDHIGLTPLEYAHREGHQKVADVIIMAARFPPSKLSVPGNMLNSNDFIADEAERKEDGMSVAAIIGIILGVCLGASTGLLMAMVFARRLHLYKSQSASTVLPESMANGHSKVLRTPQADGDFQKPAEAVVRLGEGQISTPVVMQAHVHQQRTLLKQLSRESLSSSDSDGSQSQQLVYARSKPLEDIDAEPPHRSPKSCSVGRSRTLGFQASAPKPPAIPEHLPRKAISKQEATQAAWQGKTDRRVAPICTAPCPEPETVLRNSASLRGEPLAGKLPPELVPGTETGVDLQCSVDRRSTSRPAKPRVRAYQTLV